MKKSKTVFFIFAFLVPVLIVYKNFFLPGPLAWGDAPHFYSEEIIELFTEPLTWVSRGYNFGNINLTLWLSPLMLLFGALNKFLGFGNDLIIRLIFYFPSIIFASAGSYFFIKYLKFSKIASFFTVLTYTLNTYILMLIDGGQVGVALAYGIFPVGLLFLKKLVDDPSINNFFIALMSLTFLSIADPRLALICLFTLVVFQIGEMKVASLKYLLPFVFCFILLNLYWLYPLFKNTGGFGDISVGSNGLRFYHPFLLYAPHWPLNLFGVSTKPPVYFLIAPVILFIGLFFKRDPKIKASTLVFLVSSLLIIGVGIINKLPFGFAFRDTTKFFTPLMLFAGILIGNSIESIKLPFAISKKVFGFFSYIFLLLLVLPGLLGKLNFVLSNRGFNPDIKKINEYLISDKSFYRSLWIPERYPTNFETNNSPAVDGKDLIKNKPFSILNASEDMFNFLYNEAFVSTAKRFGIKYVIFGDNPRELVKSASSQKDWEALKKAAKDSSELKKIDLNIETPFYKIEDSYPRFYMVKTINGVVGPALVGGKEVPNAIYFEDGKLNPRLLGEDMGNSVVIFFNNSDKLALAMSFLQKHFKSPMDANTKGWAVYTDDQYLKYKYELLIRGVKFVDLDYSKGIAFSTIKGEKLEYKWKIEEKGEYFLIERSMTPSLGESNLKWTITTLNLEKGEYLHSFENSNDLKILNVVGLIPKKDYEEAILLADTFMKHFKSTKAFPDISDFQELNPEFYGALKYKFIPVDGYKWLVFNDTYHPLWKLKVGDTYFGPLPLYSMVNGFYVGDQKGPLQVVFKGQENFRLGLYISVVSMLLLTITYLWFSQNKKSIIYPRPKNVN